MPSDLAMGGDLGAGQALAEEQHLTLVTDGMAGPMDGEAHPRWTLGRMRPGFGLPSPAASPGAGEQFRQLGAACQRLEPRDQRHHPSGCGRMTMDRPADSVKLVSAFIRRSARSRTDRP